MKKLLILALAAMALMGCKQDNWLDWKVQNELWLQQNAKKDGVITTPTGLQYKIIQKGVSPTSAKPDEYKIVTIKYTGTFITGYVFDSSDQLTTSVSGFVTGFIEGLKKMNEFDEYELYIPYSLAYGTNGSGSEGGSAFIPPYSTLIFRVTLCGVN